MPRIVVFTEGPKPEVMMEESVKAVQMADAHSLHQLIERVSWAVLDADDNESGVFTQAASAQHLT